MQMEDSGVCFFTASNSNWQDLILFARSDHVAPALSPSALALAVAHELCHMTVADDMTDLL